MDVSTTLARFVSLLLPLYMGICLAAIMWHRQGVRGIFARSAPKTACLCKNPTSTRMLYTICKASLVHGIVSLGLKSLVRSKQLDI